MFAKMTESLFSHTGLLELRKPRKFRWTSLLWQYHRLHSLLC